MSQTAIGITQEKHEAGTARVDMKLEVALIPVSDVDRAKEFYTNLGWRLDSDDAVGNDVRIVQLTPAGSGCSVSFGKGITPVAPGAPLGGLIVSDIEAAHKELVAKGINVSEVFHGSPFSRISGPDPERKSYGSFLTFEDPDRNVWIVQEVTRRLPGRVDPAMTTFASANDLASAMRRAAAAHGEHEKHNGHDTNWLKQLFVEARSRDYQRLLHEVKKVLAIAPSRRPGGALNRIRRRFVELQDIDFFENPMRGKIENLLAHADQIEIRTGRKAGGKSSEYVNRVWMTRPRPGIDRVSSAWLIRRFIDPKARFIFDADPNTHTEAIPFDMFCPQGFGHRGEDCTFETLQKEFSIKDSRVKRIAQIIHDADLGDEKFGRAEGQGLDKVLNGWAKQDLPDDELLQRGMDLIEGLYESMG